jgi:hypothetical protein
MKTGLLNRAWRVFLLVFPLELLAGPLNEWTWRFPNPQGNILTAITYGGGLFVAVGDNGTIITSADGAHWLNQASGVSACLRGVAYGQGEYAAVGDEGLILISSNALVWQQIPTVTNITLRAIAGAIDPYYCALAQFVTVGDGGTALAGKNGTNWFLTPSGTTNALYAVTDDYTIVGEAGTVLYLDYPGPTQIPSNDVGTTGNLYAIATSNYVTYVAAGDLNLPSGFYTTEDEILYSLTQALTWKSEQWVGGVGSSPPFQTLWYLSENFVLKGLAGGRQGFAGVGYTGYGLEYHPAVVMYSTTGTNWIELPSSVCEDNLNAIACGNGVYVGVGDFGSIIVSTNATNWTEAIPDRHGFIAALACNANLCIATAASIWYSWGFPDFSTLVSSNGIDWTVSGIGPIFLSDDPHPFSSISDLACSPTTFVGVCSAGVCTTTDGYNWDTNDISTNSLYGVGYANGCFFAVGENGTICSSVDGTNWGGHSINTPGSLYAIAYGNDLYVAAGTVSAVSTDGANWTLAPTNPPVPISKMVYGNGLFVGVSYAGDILYSSDGLSWQAGFTEPGGEAFSGIAYNGGIFLAISGKSGAMFESTDGRNWQATGSTMPYNSLGLSAPFFATVPGPLGLFGYYATDFPNCYATVCPYKGSFLIGGAEGMLLQSGNLPPAFTSVQIMSNEFCLSYNVQPDVTYRIQQSPDLIHWSDLYSGLGTGQTTSFSAGLTNAAGGFYRISSP